jgi:phospholipid transport system transporter-binding protein
MISCNGDKCAISGALILENVVTVLEESGRVLPAAGRVVIDLAGVTEVDSSAVSLLLELRRGALRQSRVIEYVNLPHNLQSLAELYGVSELLAAS